MVAIPERLRWLTQLEGGGAWLDALPSVVAEVRGAWSLTLGEPFADGYVSFACPAGRPDGSDAVLKVQFPHFDCRDEAAALRDWAGRRAALLLDHDAERHALLLERCRPGTPLSALGEAGADDALAVFADLLPRLWIPVRADAPYEALADVGRWWARDLSDRWERAGEPFERRLVDAGVELALDLAGSTTEQVLVNQDLHGDNVLAAEREPWLAIDPKPVAGERAFGLAPLIRAYEFGHSRAAVHHRLDRLSADLGVDRERARAWTIAQAVAWSIEGDATVRAHHLDTARWLLDGPPG